MELVDNYVIKLLSCEPVEMALPAERLNRREHDVGRPVALRARILAEHGARMNRTEGSDRLVEYFLTMRDEEHVLCARLRRVESTEPSLTEPRREHDESSGVPGFACLRKLLERQVL